MNIALPVPISEYEAPEGWQVQPLSKLCAEVIERVDPITMNGDIGGHYIGLEHMGQGSGQLEGVGSAAEVVSQKSRFQAGNILFGKLRPNLRKVARPDFGGVCSTDIIVLRAKSAADPAFLFQVLQSEPLVAHAVATAAGTKMPRTHARSILSFEIAVPPLDEQRRIAEVLRSVDEAIAAADAVAQQWEVTFTTLLDAAFSDGEASSLGELCSLIYRYPGFYGFDQLEEGVPVIRGEHLRAGRISSDWADFYFVDPAFSARFPKTVLQLDDVVMSVRGTVGTTAVVGAAHVGSQISPNLIRLVADPAKIVPPLLYYAVQSAVARMRRTIVNAQALPAINAGDLKRVEIAVPRLPEQPAMLAELNGATEAVAQAVSAVAKARQTKTTLMSDLLSGRVRVPA